MFWGVAKKGTHPRPVSVIETQYIFLLQSCSQNMGPAVSPTPVVTAVWPWPPAKSRRRQAQWIEATVACYRWIGSLFLSPQVLVLASELRKLKSKVVSKVSTEIFRF